MPIHVPTHVCFQHMCATDPPFTIHLPAFSFCGEFDVLFVQFRFTNRMPRSFSLFTKKIPHPVLLHVLFRLVHWSADSLCRFNKCICTFVPFLKQSHASKGRDISIKDTLKKKSSFDEQADWLTYCKTVQCMTEVHHILQWDTFPFWVSKVFLKCNKLFAW